MVIAEMRAAHVPVKIFRLQIQRENIGEKLAQDAANFRHAVVAKVGGGCERFIHARRGLNSVVSFHDIDFFG
jgi:hypothetical protein